MPKIVLVGAGRIAWHLGRRLKGKGLPVAQLINRSEEKARELADTLQTSWSTNFADLLPDADWIIIAVRDDAITSVAESMSPFVGDCLVTHTSGGTAGAVLAPFIPRYGVFYPLQSFSFEHTPVWSKIPFCVDAINQEDVLFLKRIAKTIGNLVYQVTDNQRTYLHVAAVFANNFANHCFSIAEKILDEQDLPFELLHPLMEETLAKALQDSPGRMQTGPAIRGDTATIGRHLDLLMQHPDWQELYKQLSKNINGELGMP
ncbi:MAG: DUF2520 domain-containing protein [Saprospiraceae bacterium]|nr:DUF2520 domain-containing protein [Saprospiraceae bacterium]